jgi:excisionase family DNA binding protein
LYHMNNIPEKSFLTKKELSLMLGISIFTLDSWVSERREIPFVKMGKRVMFDLSDVYEWIECHKIHPRAS